MTQPNIVMILADDLADWQMRWMPRTKRIAKLGVDFAEYYVALPFCQPSRVTMLTGQYAHNHGVPDNVTSWLGTVNLSTCLPADLQRAGYKVGLHGKPPNSYLPSNLGGAVPTGFDDWFGINPQTYYGYNYNLNGVQATAGLTESEYHTTACATHAINFINSATEPFCVFFWPHAPHLEGNPTSGPGGMGAMTGAPNLAYKGVMASSHLVPREADFNTLMANAPSYLNVPALDTLTIDGIDRFGREQAEMLFQLDASIGQILNALSTHPNTIVIFTSDNGFFHGELRNPNQKQDGHFAGSRVPCFISGPGITPGRCPRIVAQVDVIATIYALTGATPSRTQDGISLVPLLTNPVGPPIRSGALVELLVTEAAANSLQHPRFFSLIKKDYIYTEYPDTSEKELFDRAADPRELVNQAANPTYSPIVSSMAAELAPLKTCTGSACVV